MKKIFRQLLMLSLVGGMVFLYSCGEDEEPSPLPTVSPSASVDGTDITSSGEAVAGSLIDVTVTIVAEGGFNTLNVSDGSNSLTFTRDSEGLEAGTVNHTIEFEIETDDDDAGTEITYTFEVVDDENQIGTATWTLTLLDPPSPDVTSYSATILYGQSNADGGSFYDVVTNSVLGATDAFATANQASLDMVFWYGSTSMYAIGSVADATATTAFDAVGINLANLATRNATLFKVLETTAEEFEAIATDDDLLNAFGEVAADASNVTGLSAGDVFGVTLADSRGSKTALVHVEATGGDSGASRTITINVKLETGTP